MQMSIVSKAMQTRMQRELALLEKDPPPGVQAWPVSDQIDHIQSIIHGPDDSPYARGIFKLEVTVPPRYPFEPPKVRFITPIYHPNIDSSGRICLDTLNMPPKGSWRPSINISTLLSTIRLLMAHPNSDDPLEVDIAREFVAQNAVFESKAKAWTVKHACDDLGDGVKETEIAEPSRTHSFSLESRSDQGERSALALPSHDDHVHDGDDAQAEGEADLFLDMDLEIGKSKRQRSQSQSPDIDIKEKEHAHAHDREGGSGSTMISQNDSGEVIVLDSDEDEDFVEMGKETAFSGGKKLSISRNRDQTIEIETSPKNASYFPAKMEEGKEMGRAAIDIQRTQKKRRKLALGV